MNNLITRGLFTISVFGCLLLVGRFGLYYAIPEFYPTRHPVNREFPPYYFFFFIWNLLLAWIPYALSTWLPPQAGINWKVWVVSFLWLLFLPNAPYIITDLMHLRHRHPIPYWYDIITFFLFAAAGLFLGLFSMQNVKRFWQRYLPARSLTPLIIAVWVLCSFGLYLGRYGRWNSWDLVSRPVGLFKYIFKILTDAHYLLPVLGFTLVFTLFLCIGYFFLDHYQRLAESPASQAPLTAKTK